MRSLILVLIFFGDTQIDIRSTGDKSAKPYIQILLGLNFLG
ncbi:MAG: hypothetical protein ACJAUP_001853 [Cellvibrionaceae bacterium]|jgi:hypothetical protein